MRATTVSASAWNRRGDVYGWQAQEAIKTRQYQSRFEFRKATHRVGNVGMCQQPPLGGDQQVVGVAGENSMLGYLLANTTSWNNRHFASDRFHAGVFIDPGIARERPR